MKQSELKALVINKLVERRIETVDGEEVAVMLPRNERDIYYLITKTAFLYFTRISGSSAYTMAKSIIKYLETYNI